MKIVHVNIGLHVGGAEMMLLKLLESLDRTQFEPTVIALMDGGEISSRIQDLGIPVHHLGMRSVLDTPAVMLKLRRLARELDPDVVQGWMYHGNLAAKLLAGWAPRHPDLYWNIRHTLADPSQEKFITRKLICLGGRWSKRAIKIVHNSQVSVGQHEQQGFATDNSLVIANGFDVEKFQPSETAGRALRAELGLAADAILVGTLGRYHKVKGHAVFMAALAKLRQRPEPVHFLCAGLDVTAENLALAAMVAASGCGDRVHLLGQHSDPAAFLAGLDIFCLPSLGEGFPNALGEAMACGVPCVSTAVGEAPFILEDLSETVPPGDSTALATALDKMLDRGSPGLLELGGKSRARIVQRYELSGIAAQYAELYASGQGMTV